MLMRYNTQYSFGKLRVAKRGNTMQALYYIKLKYEYLLDISQLFRLIFGF